MKRKVNPLTSKNFTGLKLTKPAEYAAGAEAVKVAMEHIFAEMGPVRAFKALSKLNQKKGFDCPGCAWPDPDDKRSVLGEYCENGAKAIAEEATLKKVDVSFFGKHTIEEISEWSDLEIGKSGRLTEPMLLHQNSLHYKPISWEDAFSLIADHLQKLETPDQAIFYTSGRSSNEAAFLYGLFCRAFGTNNMPDCSNMCHESSGVGLSQTLGIGKGSVVLDDFEKSELVIILGQNPGTNHPRMLTALQKCKKNGGKIVTINPLIEAGLRRFKNPQSPIDLLTSGTNLTDLYLQVKINQDVPLLQAAMKGLLELNEKGEEVLDQKFINERTAHFELLTENLRKQETEDLLKRSGISNDELEEFVQLLASKSKIIICWAMGLTQHKNGVDNIKECVNLLLMKGSIGKEGSGTCPVRGHSNVQGDRSVGIVHRTSPALKSSLKKVFGIDAPEKPGLDVVHSIMAMHEKKAKVFMALGGNFVSAASDTHYTAEAIQNCDLTVAISTKLNRSHLIAGKTALILPTLGRSEIDKKNGAKRFITVENSMGKVQSSKGALEPISDKLMSEPEIIAKIGHAVLGDEHPIDWLSYGKDYGLIRDKIGEVLCGFESYNEKVADNKEFYLPNNARAGDFSKLPGGRAQFSVIELPNHQLQEDEYLLMSIRSHDQFNTTIYGLNDRYRGVHNERRVLFMNEKDIARQGFNPKDVVDLSSSYDGKLRIETKFLVIPYNIPTQNLACYFPEANSLVPINHFAKESHTPISKSIKVKVSHHKTHKS